MEGTTKKETWTIFETDDEKKMIYSITVNPMWNELEEIITKHEEILAYIFVHKLNSKLKLLHIFRKMQFGAQLAIILVATLYMAFALYLAIFPLDTMEATYSGITESIQFNHGALVFAAILQMLIWAWFILFGVVSIISLKKNPEGTNDLLDTLLISKSIPLLILFFSYCIIRICVYSVGMQEWLESKSLSITHTTTFVITGERDIILEPSMSKAAVQWVNFKFIFPGIVGPWITFYILFFLIIGTLAAINGIHRSKINDRDMYISTLYHSENVQNYIKNKKSISGNSDVNDRDDKFDEESDQKYSTNNKYEQFETMRESAQHLTDMGIRDSYQVSFFILIIPLESTI